MIITFYSRNINLLSKFLLVFILGIISCKKENSEDYISEIEVPAEETQPPNIDNNFEHIIFKSNLKNLSTFPDELQTDGGRTLSADGVLLSSPNVLRMKYPSTLDRSQVIIDVLFYPSVDYYTEGGIKEVGLSGIKDRSIAFNGNPISTIKI